MYKEFFPIFHAAIWQINHRNTIERTLEVTLRRGAAVRKIKRQGFFRLLHKIEKCMIFLERGCGEDTPFAQ